MHMNKLTANLDPPYQYTLNAMSDKYREYGKMP